MKDRYGYDGEKEIQPPFPVRFTPVGVFKEEWEIIPEGGEIPQEHREYIKGVGWASPRRCHSTMTPFEACVWGHVLAFARHKPT